MQDVLLFDIKFVNGTYKEIRERLNKGGIMVVPAAPALATIHSDAAYYEALKQSDFAIFDSGFLCLLLLILKGFKAKKLSGLAFLRSFLTEVVQMSPNTVFLIDPSPEDSVQNRSLLNRMGYDLKESHQYVAPKYASGEIQDARVIAMIRELRPSFVIINLGGGVQERLGVYLAKNLDFKPSFICTGAAIAFLTGSQASIPSLVDRLYLGWLVRCISDPGRYIPRYLQGFRLIPMISRADVKKGIS